MTRDIAAHYLILGPQQHGVTRYAELLAAAGGVPPDRVTRTGRAIALQDLDALAGLLPDARLLHLHVTDHLLGRSPEEAAEVVAALAAHRPISLTLHDLPQPSDGRVQPRRAAAYAAMARTAVATVVSSNHEHGLLMRAMHQAQVAPSGPVTVIPLAVEPPRSRVMEPAEDPPDAAVLGWVYPGKGHTETLDALRGLPGEVGLAVLGGASPGHEGLLVDLRRRAGELRRRLTITGWVPDADMTSTLRRVAVPVVAHRHISASGSLATWLSAARRPVVSRSAYTEELADRLPGTLTLVDDDPGELSTAIRTALADPPSTWLSPGTALGPSAAEAARQLDAWLHRWSS